MEITQIRLEYNKLKSLADSFRKMKILVTGGSGMIGSSFVSELAKKGHDVLYTYLSRKIDIEGGEPISLDISKRELVSSIFQDFQPDLTIHCSAVTKVDLCETNPSIAEAINVQGTKNVADACKNVNSKLIYISTSFVFDGSKKIFYEDDETNPINEYGKTKLEGEKIVRKSGLPFMIIRTDHPYKWSPLHIEKNNVMRMIGLFERKEKFREADDWFNTPTLVDNLVEASLKLIENWEDGIYQIVGSDYISRYDLAMKVAEAIGGDNSLVEKVKSSIFNLPTKRPNVHMSNVKVQKKTNIKLLGIEEGIKFILDQRSS